MKACLTLCGALAMDCGIHHALVAHQFVALGLFGFLEENQVGLDVTDKLLSGIEAVLGFFFNFFK